MNKCKHQNLLNMVCLNHKCSNRFGCQLCMNQDHQHKVINFTTIQSLLAQYNRIQKSPQLTLLNALLFNLTTLLTTYSFNQTFNLTLQQVIKLPLIQINKIIKVYEEQEQSELSQDMDKIRVNILNFVEQELKKVFSIKQELTNSQHSNSKVSQETKLQQHANNFQFKESLTSIKVNSITAVQIKKCLSSNNIVFIQPELNSFQESCIIFKINKIRGVIALGICKQSIQPHFDRQSRFHHCYLTDHHGGAYYHQRPVFYSNKNIKFRQQDLVQLRFNPEKEQLTFMDEKNKQVVKLPRGKIVYCFCVCLFTKGDSITILK